MQDPYQVLGVSRTDDDETIKKAYYALAKKYHPDNYQDHPLSDLVEEKMKEINEAYAQIQKERAAAKHAEEDFQQNTQDFSDSRYTQIRQQMQMGSYAQAELMLDAIPQGDRNAEWHYLKGCVLTRRGWFYDAQTELAIACRMDPQNAEYRAAAEQMRTGAQSYGGQYRDSRGTDTACNCCANLICADCLCEMCGGDLIRCI